jgi:hypothetical protein
MTYRTLTQAALGLLLLLAAPALAITGSERKSFVVSRADSSPVIDGLLDDDAWRHAVIVDDFHQTVPTDGATPTERTIVRVMYDDEFLYIAANLRDSDPQAIQALQLIQGKLFFSDDRFWVMLDSFNSKRNDYLFQVNANGVRREVLRENNSRFIEEWETIWYAESAIHANGWATEIAIPFKSISFSPESDTWGINFGRGIVRKQEFALWSSHDRQDWPAYGGEVSGISDIEQGLGLDIVPSINLQQERDLELGESQSSFDPSLDIRYRITPSLSATFTLNTDFATAEVDELQVTLDRFSLFFPEKRDFFLQDAGIFEFGNIDTNGRPFFSRRIGLSEDGETIDIVGGAKLTGRIGDFNIGALAIRQDAFADIAATDLFVARGSRNVLGESAVGFIVTNGDPGSNNNNSLLGADFLYRNSNGPFGQIVTGNLWAQQSKTTGLDGKDRAYGALLEMPNDIVSAYLRAEEIQENFNPALGFVNRTDIRRFATGARYRTRPGKGLWRTINHRIDFNLVTNMAGKTLTEQTRIRPVTLGTHNGDFMFIEWQSNEEFVEEPFDLFDRLNVPVGRYKFDRYRAEFASGMGRPLRVVLSVQDGGFFDGDRLEKFFELEWRQSAHFSLALALTENDVELPSGNFTSHLGSFRTDIAFSSRWSWSNLLQYDNTDDVVGINSRLRYIPEAGRELMLVVNHLADVDASNRLTSRRGEVNLKLSYTFRY